MSNIRPYLDKLSNDVHHIIIRKLDSLLHALYYSMKSEERRKAVISFYDNSLDLKDEHHSFFYFLISLFGDDLKTLELRNLVDSNLLKSIPPISSLEDARIIANEEQIRVIKESYFISRLSVIIKKETCWEEILSLVKSIPLFYLRMDFDWDKTPKLPGPETQEELAKACACLQTLRGPMVPRTVGEYTADFVHDFKPFISNLEFLESIQLTCNIVLPNSSRTVIERIKSISLYGNCALINARNINGNIESIKQTWRVSGETLQSITSMPKLKTLRIFLSEGTEHHLIGKFPEVENLELWYQMEAGLRRHGLHHLARDHPDDRALRKLVTESTKLKEFGFVDGRCIRSFLLDIVKLLNKRLTRLTTDVPQTSVEVREIFDAISKWCPNIRALRFVRLRRQKESWVLLNNALLEATEAAEKKCPLLDIKSIKDSFAEFMVQDKRQDCVSHPRESGRKDFMFFT